MSWRALAVTRKPSEAPPPIPTVFHPAEYSRAELHFLLDHFGELPAAVFTDREMPAGVNAAAVEPLLIRTYELAQLEKVRSMPWAGYDAIKDAIVRYLAWTEKSLAVYNRTKRLEGEGRIRHPSQHHFDGRRKAIAGAVGTDSKNKVVSEILSDGTRRLFAVDLLQADAAELLSSALSDPLGDLLSSSVQSKPAFDELEDDTVNGRLICPICKHTENYDVTRRQARYAAGARMTRHLNGAKHEIDRHRILAARLKSR